MYSISPLVWQQAIIAKKNYKVTPRASSSLPVLLVRARFRGPRIA
jgi:hypothetical protein